MRKVQVFLERYQAELTVECLKYARMRLGEVKAEGPHARISRPFTVSRIDEVLALFEKAMATGS